MRSTRNTFHPHITCQLCAIKGHYQTHCPVAINAKGAGITTENQPDQGTGTTVEPDEVSLKIKSLMKSGVDVNQNNNSYINPKWVLLKSETMDHIL